MLAVACVVGSLLSVCLGSWRLIGLISNTLVLACGALALSLPLGTIWGAAIAKIDVSGRRLMVVLLGSMLLLPLAVQAGAWQAAMASGGWLPTAWGSSAYAPTFLRGMTGAVWVHGMASIPWVAVFVAAALATVPREVEEESLLDASGWRVFWRVSLAHGACGWGAAALWIVVVCGTEISVTDFFLTTAEENTFAEEIYNVAALGSVWDIGAPIDGASPAGRGAGPSFSVRSSGPLHSRDLVLGSVFFSLLALGSLSLLVGQFPVESTTLTGSRWTWRPAHRRSASAIAWLVVFACVAIPLIATALKAGAVVIPTEGRPLRSWSAWAMAEQAVVSPWQLRREWGWTLMISGAAAGVAVGTGFVVCWYARRHRLVAALAAVTFAASFAIPGPMWAQGLIVLLNRPADSSWHWLNAVYDRTLFAPIVVQAIRAWPAALLFLWLGVRSVPQEMLDNARTDGVGPWQRLAYLGMPYCAKSVGKATALAFALSMGELSATLLVTPPGVTPLVVRLFGLLHYGVDAPAAGICMSLFAVCGLLAFVAAPWSLLQEACDESKGNN